MNAACTQSCYQLWQTEVILRRARTVPRKTTPWWPRGKRNQENKLRMEGDMEGEQLFWNSPDPVRYCIFEMTEAEELPGTKTTALLCMKMKVCFVLISKHSSFWSDNSPPSPPKSLTLFTRRLVIYFFQWQNTASIQFSYFITAYFGLSTVIYWF